MMEFLAQGGFAFYVWSAFGACAVLMAAEVVLLKRQRKELIRQIRRLIRMKSQENPS